MIDPKLLRQGLDLVAEKLKTRGFQLDIKVLQTLENQRKTLQTQVEQLQAKRNDISKQVGQAKARGENTDTMMAEVNAVGETLKASEASLEIVQTQFNDLALRIPDIS